MSENRVLGFMIVLAWNDKGEALGLLFDNYECSSAIAIELQAIQKAYLVSNNYLDKETQIESDSKVVVEALLGINTCPWIMISVFPKVHNLFYSLNNVDLVHCPCDCSESAHEAAKWVESVVQTGNQFLLDVHPNVESSILHDSFATINE